mmetsp:Transcript_28964/g.54831  ORF Transcript_28964/g.54831 Transcript_28964/m.54831 type:complete len:219 (-) Transcript_28964:3998-4654(-)
MTLRKVTVQEQPSSPTLVSDPDTATSYNGGRFVSSWAITSEVSSHEAPLAMIFDVVYPSYISAKLVRCETESSPPTPDVSTVLVVMTCFALVDPRQVFPPSGNARISAVSSPSNLNLKLELGSTSAPPPSTVMVWTSFIVPFLSSVTIIDGISLGVPVREESATSNGISPRCDRNPSSRKETVQVHPPTISNGVRSTWTRAMDDNPSNSSFTVRASAS